MNRIVRFFILIFSVCISPIYAGLNTHVSKLNGTQIVNNAVLELQEDKFDFMQTNPGASGWMNVFAQKAVNNRVHLKYTGSKTQHYSTSWWVEAVLQIERWDATTFPATALPVQQCTLRVTYNPQAQTVYQDISTFSSINGYKTKVTVLNVSSSLSGNSVPDDVVLENEIEVERYYKLNTSANIGITVDNLNPCSTIPYPNTLEFRWDYLPGAEEYDLEWLFISAYDLNAVANPDFTKATRITTTNQDYTIHLSFDKGYLMYRVRGIGKDINTFSKRIEGSWSATSPQICLLNTDTKRNWTYNATYAEEGKVKEVMTYFDGSQRNRQAVTLSNSNQVALIAETIYDYEGRPAIHTLPAPAFNYSDDLKFYQNLSLNQVHFPYSRKDFDTDNQYPNCGTSNVTGMTSVNPAGNNVTNPTYNIGASYYYSDNNTSALTNGFNVAIPDAQEFPFTQIVYANDGTPKQQSGLGNTFRTGTGHETKYLNANASQEKLDRLFGNEVGYAEHYREKVVIDPNGQISVSYEDLSGKVIATAMRGNAPANLETLNTNGTSSDIDEQYMTSELIKEDFSGLNQYDPASESYVTVKNFPVDNINTTYHFQYELTPEMFHSLCNNQNYSCKYILEITVKDDCNNDVVAPYTTSIDASNYTSSSFIYPFDVNFNHVGVYRIQKKLSLDPLALQQYLAAFEADLRDPSKNTCIQSLSELTDQYEQGIDMSECLTCEQNCEQDAQNQGYIVGSTAYDDFVAQCKTENCVVEAEPKSCDELLQSLKDDMSPGGQYFEYEIPNGSTIGSVTFNSSNGSGVKYIDAIALLNLGTPPNDYESEFINFIATNSCQFPPSSSNGTFTYDNLKNNWNPCYADFLVQYHPEYCRYNRCSNLKSSFDYNVSLKTLDYAGAIAHSPDLTQNDNIATQDPYFTGVGVSDLSAIHNQIVNCTNCATSFPTGVFGIPASQSMWDYAAIAPQPAANNNDQWSNFLSIYLSEKAKLEKNYGCSALPDTDNPPDNVSNQTPNIISVTAGQTIVLDHMQINDPEPVTTAQNIASNPSNTAPYENMANDTCVYGQASLSITSENNEWQASCPTPSLPYEHDPVAIQNINGQCTIILYAQIPNQHLNPPYDMTTVPGPNYYVQISSPVLVPLNLSSPSVTNLYLNSIVTAINSYNSSPYDFTGQVTAWQTTAGGAYSLKILAPNSLGNLGSQVKLKIVEICTQGETTYTTTVCSDPFRDPQVTCSYTLTNCICWQLDAIKTTYNYQDASGNYPLADHSTYPTWESYAAASLSQSYSITPAISISQIQFWDQNCKNNNDGSPLILNNEGVEDPENPSNIANAIPPSMACDAEEPCQQQGFDEADFYAEEEFESQIQEQLEDFKKKYKEACFGGNYKERFKVEYQETEYHYTLYYYDRAGNLVRTVPPKAVKRIPAAQLYNSNGDNLVHLSRLANSGFIYPGHSRLVQSGSLNGANAFVTNYKYNSYNQLTQQETPDGGLSQFWYDDLGRLRFSQNAKQAAATCAPQFNCFGHYSYTMYDAQSRIIEVGENDQVGEILSGNPPMQYINFVPFSSMVNDPTFPSANGTEVTKTYYDAPLATNAVLSQFTNGQPEFLRKRVAHTTFESIEDNDDNTYNSATHYSYDVHGNVYELIQENPDLAAINNQYKKTVYDYDLISGKVNEVSYQPGQKDQFHHRYEYDADNRITNAWTSKDYIHWTQDAKYFYYLHGPLARVEMGDDKVQALDYAYTIQGWIKAVNTNNADRNNDVGMDGLSTVSYLPGQNNLHSHVAADAFGYSLHYFAGDYTSIKTNIDQQVTASIEANSALFGSSPDLYNGNIKAMLTGMYKPNGAAYPLQMDNAAKFFKYDQLNRIIEAQIYTGTTFAAVMPHTNPSSSDYFENFRYDENGNIKFANRRGYTGSGFNNDMDQMTYHYINGNNQLQYVSDNGDNANSANFNDIKDQSAHLTNYGYDQIGNLTKDETEDIADISWSVYGKILKITRTSGSTKPDLEFKYDATGNRICKIVKYKDGFGNLWTPSDWTYQYYSRDAQGNVMEVYEQNVSNSHVLYLKERHIYGSKREGIISEYINMETPAATDGITTSNKGIKIYELSNHLGDVMVVVSDRKIGIDNNSDNIVDYYIADVLYAVDRYPGGQPMPGRIFNANAYRYGYNKGSEKDDEITGSPERNITTFHREGDTYLLTWWTPDPVFNPSQSPYSWMDGNPIKNNDPKGDCPTCPKEGGFKLNYSLGGGGFSASLYGGISTQNNFAMAGLNASATFYRGGAGTSKSSPNLFNFTLSPSLTFGGGTAAPMSLNLFNGMSGTGVNNTFKNSFTFGGNMVFSSGTNSDGSGRSQWLGAASFRLGDFSMGSYNDTWKPPLFMGQGSDQFWSAGLNAQIQNGDYNLSWSNDMYYGMSNSNATYSDDRIINGQNYDNQRLFDMMLNNGRENITLSSGRFGIMQSGTRSGYQTFYPSNTMHNNMHYDDPQTGGNYSFHHLFVPYPNTQQRTIMYLNGKTP